MSATLAVRHHVRDYAAWRTVYDEVESLRAQHDNARKQWLGEHATALKSDFLQELVKQRYQVYPPVLRTLGAVRDIPDSARDHYESLKPDPRRLLQTADGILRHLHGEPGLAMSMDTRNHLLSTWYACHLFRTGNVTIEQLVNEFYQARRRLREDLQIDDSGSPTTIKDIESGLAK